jgi:hypothetical protein
MWVELKISGISLSQFNTSNKLFRKISKSSLKIGATSNNEFWKKSVYGGYYRDNIFNEKLEFQFYLNLNDSTNTRRFELELRVRLGKIGIPKFQFTLIDEPVFVLKNQNFYKKFGIYYFVP